MPGSKTNEQTQTTNLIVTITSGGAIYAGQDETTIEQLPVKLNEIRGSVEKDNLILRADKTVAIDQIIKVIDAAKSIGIDKFTIETEKEQL